MRKVDHLGFVALSMIFHVTYIFSIFDMYFVDPVVQGLQTFRVEDQFGTVAPAKRLILFVGDGVRADKTFQGFLRRSNDTNDAPLWHAAPFLRSRILSHGTYGISHARIPSKTRPGHVAITAGLYEDISALTAEWNSLEAEIDNVFTRSHRAWMWGSPDIVPALKGSTRHQRIYTDTYSEALEDFASDATELDTWVFDKVKDIFQHAKKNRHLELALKEERSIFFLHLLGPDTTGHAYRPSSQEYLDNIRHVDSGIQEVTELIQEFFGDNQTAFIFTSDHGMSDWGSHGDGNPDNTRTPIVAWGAGIAKPQPASNLDSIGKNDLLSSSWALDHIKRHDIQQADVAALITYLLGNEFPVSSVGCVPLPYLDADMRIKALTAMVNVKSLLELYRAKEEQKKAAKIRFSPHGMCSRENLEQQISRIQTLISSGKYEEAIWVSRKVYSKTRESLDYLQTYDWLFLGTIIITGYLSWILFVLSRVIYAYLSQDPMPPTRSRIRIFVICSILLGLFSVFRYERSPWRYYLYPVFPALFCEQILARWGAFAEIKVLFVSPMHWVSETSQFKAVVVFLFLEALISSYFHREAVTYFFWVASLYPMVYGWSFLRRNYKIALGWVLCCFQMSIFTILPALKVEDISLLVLGGMLISLTGVLYLCFELMIAHRIGCIPSTRHTQTALGIQVTLVFIAIFVASSSARSLGNKHGLPSSNRAMAWAISGISLVFPYFYRLGRDKFNLTRSIVDFLCFAPTYVLLTISYESIFYFCFFMTILFWLGLNKALYWRKQPLLFLPLEDKSLPESFVTTRLRVDPKHDRPNISIQIHNALFLCFILHAAIFSAGNTSSLSSFSLESVCRFVTTFSPAAQGGLLGFKLLIPLSIVLVMVHVLSRSVGLPTGALFAMATCLLDLVILRFFLTLQSSGDWHVVGAGINHFLLANILLIGASGLEVAICIG